MDELRDEVTMLEAALRASTNPLTLEHVLKRGERAVQRLDALAALADRLATQLRARVIADCRERLGAAD
jgi:hypothetical protein